MKIIGNMLLSASSLINTKIKKWLKTNYQGIGRGQFDSLGSIHWFFAAVEKEAKLFWQIFLHLDIGHASCFLLSLPAADY